MMEAFVGPTVEDEMTEDEWGISLSGYAPVRDAEGRAVAVVGVDVTGARVGRIDAHALRAIGLAYGAALLVLLVIGLFLGRSIRRPIERIVRASDAIASGDLGARVALVRDDELGILAARFDAMATGLEERERLRAVFGRYVSEEVARRALESPDAARLGGEDREVSVLFIDIVRSSVLGEVLEPHEIVEMLETYLAAMTELVEEHRGCVIEMLGDAILAVFNAPDALEEHAARAVECGVAMKARLELLNDRWEASGLAQRWKDSGIERLRGRIGIHTGHVIAGNTGGETRMKYAVIGDTVNVAARVEALNGALGTTMLVSAATHAQLPEALAAEGEPRGEHAVKGRDQRVEVFSY
jgi:adenylate cyclase